MAQYKIQQGEETTVVNVVDDSEDETHYHVNNMQEGALDAWDNGADIEINKAHMTLDQVRSTFGDDVANEVSGEFNE